MDRTKRIAAIVLTMLVAMTIGGCRQPSATGPNTTATQTTTTEPINTTLRLRWLTQSQFAGIYWAQDHGLFEREGLKVTVNPGGPGINFMEVVGSGAEDFGICGAAQIVEARDKGVPVRCLAIIYQGNPNIFFAKQSSGIKTVQDWVGKKVAVFNGYDLEYMYRAMLKKAGVDPKKVTEYPAKFDMTPFFRDEVDVWAGYVINQPNTAEEKGFPVNRIYPDDYGVHVAGDCLFTTEKVIAEKPELCQKMVDAVLDGWRDALANPKGAVQQVLGLDDKLDEVHETKMIDAVAKLTLTPEIDGRIGWMTPEQWEGMIKLWKEFGGVKKDITPEECYDRRFVDTHYQEHPVAAPSAN